MEEVKKQINLLKNNYNAKNITKKKKRWNLLWDRKIISCK